MLPPDYDLLPDSVQQITGLTIFPPQRKVTITFYCNLVFYAFARPLARPLDFVREQAFQKQKWMFGYRIFWKVISSLHTRSSLPPPPCATSRAGYAYWRAYSQTWASGDLAGHGGVLYWYFSQGKGWPRSLQGRVSISCCTPLVIFHALHMTCSICEMHRRLSIIIVSSGQLPFTQALLFWWLSQLLS